MSFEVGVPCERFEQSDMEDIVYAHGFGEFEFVGRGRDDLGDLEGSWFLIVKLLPWSFCSAICSKKPYEVSFLEALLRPQFVLLIEFHGSLCFAPYG